MRRLSGRILAAGAVLLPIAPLFLGVVGADHAYSHRYIINGRLIDSEGNPIVGEEVDVGADPEINVESMCGVRDPGTGTDAWDQTGTRAVTDERGEFQFCLHIHHIPRNPRGDFHATWGDVVESFPPNSLLRTSFVVLQSEGSEGTPTEAFDGSYLVMARVLYSQGNVRHEGVTVYGNVVENENVTLRMVGPDGEELARANSFTNRYGDIAVRIPVTDVAGAKLHVEAQGREQVVDADPTARASLVELRVPNPDSNTGTLLMIAGGVAGAAILFGGGFFAWRRVQENREIAKARATSTRKRAQR